MPTFPSLPSSSTRWSRRRGTPESKEKESDKEMLFTEDKESTAPPSSSSSAALFTGAGGGGEKDVEGSQGSSSSAAALGFFPTSFDLFLSAKEETSAQFAASCLGLSIKEIMAIQERGEAGQETEMLGGGSPQKMAMRSSRVGNHNNILAMLEVSRDTTSWDPPQDEMKYKAEEKNGEDMEGIEVVELVNHTEIRTGFMHTLFDDDNTNNISMLTSSDVAERKKRKKRGSHQKQEVPPSPATSTTHSNTTKENNKGGSSLLPISSQEKEAEEEVSRSSSLSSSSSSSSPPPVLFDTFLWEEEEEGKLNKVSGDTCLHRKITSLQEREAPPQQVLKGEERKEVEQVFVVPDIDDFLSLTPPLSTSPPPPPPPPPPSSSPSSVVPGQECPPTREEEVKGEDKTKKKKKSRHDDHDDNMMSSLQDKQTSRTSENLSSSSSFSSSSSSSFLSDGSPSSLPSLPGLVHFYDPNLAPPRDQMWYPSQSPENHENKVQEKEEKNKRVKIVEGNSPTGASIPHTSQEKDTEAGAALLEASQHHIPSTGEGDGPGGRVHSSGHCMNEFIVDNTISTSTRIPTTTPAVSTTIITSLFPAPTCSLPFQHPHHHHNNNSGSSMHYRLGPLGVFGSITKDILPSLKEVIEEITDEVVPFTAEPDDIVDSNGNKKRERWDTGIEAFNGDWKAYRLAPVVIDPEREE